MFHQSIVVSQVPMGTTHKDLVDHFCRRQYGALPIDHILYPFVNDDTLAIITFKELQDLDSIMHQKHQIHGHRVSLKVLPQQTFIKCTAEVDPIITACIPDVSSFIESLKTLYGVQVHFDPYSNHMVLTGSLLQLQSSQTKLSDIYKNQQEIQQQRLFHLGSTETPRLHSSYEPLNKEGLFQEEEKEENISLPFSDTTTRGVTGAQKAYSEGDVLQDTSASSVRSQSLGPDQTELFSTETSKRLVQSKPSNIAGGNDKVEKSKLDQQGELYDIPVDELFSSSNSKERPEADNELSDVEQAVWKSQSLQGSKSTKCNEDVAILHSSFPGATSINHDLKGSAKSNEKGISMKRNVLSSTAVNNSTPNKKDLVEFEVDALVFRYMTLKHADKLLKMEKDLDVRLQFKRQGEITSIRILPLDHSTGIATTHAKEQCINIYQSVFDIVTKENLSVQVEDKMKQQQIERVIKQVSVDYKADLIIERENDNEIVIVGKKIYVSSASEYIKKVLGMKAESKNTLTGSGKAETARDLVKPKMIFMMQSLPEAGVSDLDKLKLRSDNSAFEDVGDPAEKESMTYQERSESGEFKSIATMERNNDSKFTELSSLSQDSKTRGISTKTPTSVWSIATDRSLSESDYSEEPIPKWKENQTATANLFFDSLDPDSQSRIKGARNAQFPNVTERTTLMSSLENTKSIKTKEMLETSYASHSHFNFETKEGIKVLIYSADIIQEKVTVVVNAAREDLHLLAGVSGALSQAAGPELQKECTKYIARKGNLKVTEVCHTQAGGSLQCKSIIHAVGPMWCLYTDKGKCEQALMKTVLNSLNYANEVLHARTIAIPAISTGIFGVPLDVCGRAMYEAISIYSNISGHSSLLREIRVVDKDVEATAVISLIFEQLLEVEDSSSLPERTNIMKSDTSTPRTFNESGLISPLLGATGGYTDDQNDDVREISRRSTGNNAMSNLSTHVNESEQKGKLNVNKRSTPGFKSKDDTSQQPLEGLLGSALETGGNDNREELFASNHTFTPIEYPNGDLTSKTSYSLIMDETTPKTIVSPKSTMVTDDFLPKLSETPKSSSRSENQEKLPRFLGSLDFNQEPQTTISPQSTRVTSEFLSVSSPKSHGTKATISSKLTTPVYESLSKSYETQINSPRSEFGEKSPRSQGMTTTFSPKSTLDTSGLRSKSFGIQTNSPRSGIGDRSQVSTDSNQSTLQSNFLTNLPNDSARHDTISQISDTELPFNTFSKVKSPELDLQKRGQMFYSQPYGGKMTHEINRKISCKGYEDTGTIIIQYHFPAGEHKGIKYEDTQITAYLPSTPQGRKVFQMMRKAFDVRKTFVLKVDNSGVAHITWGKIEHKTSLDAGPDRMGYPDLEYMERVKRKLEKKGYI